MNILEEAAALVAGDRQADYGPPSEHYKKVAASWGAILGYEVTPRQVALCMAALKLVREAYRPKRDNRVDGAAYIHLADILTEG